MQIANCISDPKVLQFSKSVLSVTVMYIEAVDTSADFILRECKQVTSTVKNQKHKPKPEIQGKTGRT